MGRAPADMPPTHVLRYRPPLEWGPTLAYLGARATPGVEAVNLGGGGSYRRSVRLLGHEGWMAVAPAEPEHALRVEVSAGLVPVFSLLLARVRRLFDLDADMPAITGHLAGDPVLRPLIDRRPGLRVPGAIDGFELALRAVLGQQVTVRGASTLAGRLASRFGRPLPDAPSGLTHLPASADELAGAGAARLQEIGLTRARAECVAALAGEVARGGFPEFSSDWPAGDPADFTRRFTALPGIGSWTASYVAMRALGWPDAFPEGDLGLRKAMGGLTGGQLRLAADAWRPWRAYAAQHLWASLGDSPRIVPTPR